MTRKQIIAHIVMTKQTNLGPLGAALVKAGYQAAQAS